MCRIRHNVLRVQDPSLDNLPEYGPIISPPIVIYRLKALELINKSTRQFFDIVFLSKIIAKKRILYNHVLYQIKMHFFSNVYINRQAARAQRGVAGH